MELDCVVGGVKLGRDMGGAAVVTAMEDEEERSPLPGMPLEGEVQPYLNIQLLSLIIVYTYRTDCEIFMRCTSRRCLISLAVVSNGLGE